MTYKNFIFWLILGYFCLNKLYAQLLPSNLYEQLCQVNAEWHTHKAEALIRGIDKMPVFHREQDLLSFHIQTLADILGQKVIGNQPLTDKQLENRQRHIQHLYEYANLRDCPRNYLLPYRNPIFIDDQGRYCAVAYLMKQDGLEQFCLQVKKYNNFVFIRQIQHETFAQWQKNSGLTLEELAWIQPAYEPRTSFVLYNQFHQNQPVRISPTIAKQWYNPERDTSTYMATILFGAGINYEYELKRLNYKGKMPHWDKLNNRITAITVFRNEVYVATDSLQFEYLNDSTLVRERSAIQKFNAQTNTWEIVLDLKGKERVYKFKHFNGKLLAYGGSRQYNYHNLTEKPIYSSFLAEFDGNQWIFHDKDYKAIIFRVIIQQGKIKYLGLVTDAADNLTVPSQN